MSLSLGHLLFQIKFVVISLNLGNRFHGGCKGIANWNKYKSFGKIFILIMLTLAIIEMGSSDHILRDSDTDFKNWVIVHRNYLIDIWRYFYSKIDKAMRQVMKCIH